jgi:hypothetical protein
MPASDNAVTAPDQSVEARNGVTYDRLMDIGSFPHQVTRLAFDTAQPRTQH